MVCLQSFLLTFDGSIHWLKKLVNSHKKCQFIIWQNESTLYMYIEMKEICAVDVHLFSAIELNIISVIHILFYHIMYLYSLSLNHEIKTKNYEIRIILTMKQITASTSQIIEAWTELWLWYYVKCFAQICILFLHDHAVSLISASLLNTKENVGLGRRGSG